jgi:hypothetical protein
MNRIEKIKAIRKIMAGDINHVLTTSIPSWVVAQYKGHIESLSEHYKCPVIKKGEKYHLMAYDRKEGPEWWGKNAVQIQEGITERIDLNGNKSF